MIPRITEDTKSPPYSPPYPHPLLPALPTRPHLPSTLCALTSLPMRVIGISKRWRGQKGTQPHPETLIGESLEAQHSKGESLLNYISMHTYTFLQPRSLASFFKLLWRLFIIIIRIKSESSSIQTPLFSLPQPSSILQPFFHFWSPYFWSHFSIEVSYLCFDTNCQHQDLFWL